MRALASFSSTPAGPEGAEGALAATDSGRSAPRRTPVCAGVEEPSGVEAFRPSPSASSLAREAEADSPWCPIFVVRRGSEAQSISWNGLRRRMFSESRPRSVHGRSADHPEWIQGATPGEPGAELFAWGPAASAVFFRTGAAWI
jgi:hypothetical protein